MNKKTNKKNWILLSLALCVSCGLGYYFAFEKQPENKSAKRSVDKTESTPNVAAKNKEQNEPKLAASEDHSTNATGRSAASIPDSLSKAEPRKKERPDKKWKRVLSSRLTRQLATLGVKPVIKPLGKRIIQKGYKEISAEHVMISMDKGKGQVSSYEALVNPKTGSILHTWNQTQFEHAKPLLLKVRPLRQ